MKKVLLLVLAAAFFMSGCIGIIREPIATPEVNCGRYSTEKARLACEKGKAEFRKELEEKEARQAYNEGRGNITEPQNNTLIYIDPLPFAPIIAPIYPYYYPHYPRHYYRHHRR